MWDWLKVDVGEDTEKYADVLWDSGIKSVGMLAYADLQKRGLHKDAAENIQKKARGQNADR